MKLDPNRWTLKATEAFSAATELGRSASHPEIVPEHLLLALLGQEEGIVLPLLHRVEVDIVAARNEAELVLDKLPNAYGSEPQLSRALRNVFDKADQVREDLTDEYLSTEHLLLALHGQCKGLGGVDHETLLTALRKVRGSHRVTSQNPENQYQALERFGLDLTERARKGELDPVIGRDEEIGPILAEHHLVVAPYRSATVSGIAPLAFATGRPMVVTPVGGLPEAVEHGVNGVVADAVDAVSVADAVLAAAEQLDELAAGAAASSSRWEDVASALLAVRA